MAEVNVTSLTTGVPIMAEAIGTTNYVQVVKLAGGQIGSTEQIPGDSTQGLWVNVKNSPSVQVSGAIAAVSTQAATLGAPMWLGPSQTMTVAITGPQMVTTQTAATGMLVWFGPTQTIQVSVSVSAAISTTAVATTTQTVATGAVVWLGPTQTMQAVNTIGTVLGTLAVNVVAGGAGGGTVNVSGVTPVTTQTSVSVTGLPVWFNPGALVSVSGTAVVSVVPGLSVSAVVSGTVSVLGVVPVTTQTSVSVTGLPVYFAPGALVGISVSQALGTVITILGTQIVSVVPGVSVNLGSLATIVATTTATSGVTGPIVWLGANQTIATVGTIVTVLGTQVVSVVPGLSVSAVVSGTITANVSGLVPVTTQTSVSVSGLPVWFNPGALVSVSGTAVVSVVPGVSVSLGALANVVVTTTASSGQSGPIVWLGASQSVLIGGQSVTIQQGASVSAVVSGTISVLSVVAVTTQTSVSVSGLPVWFNPGALVSVSGTALVSVVPGLSVNAAISGIVPVTTAASVSVSGMPVWLNPTQQVAVSGAISATTTQAAATGAIVWMAPTQTMIAGPSAATPVVFMVSSTALASGTTMLFTVYTGATSVVAGTSAWQVPAGKTFRIQGIQMVAASSAVVAGVQVLVLVGTAAASISVTSTVGVAAALAIVPAATAAFVQNGIGADVAAGTTIGLGNIGGTAWNCGGAVIQGILY